MFEYIINNVYVFEYNLFIVTYKSFVVGRIKSKSFEIKPIDIFLLFDREIHSNE